LDSTSSSTRHIPSRTPARPSMLPSSSCAHTSDVCVLMTGTPLDNTWLDSFAFLSLLKGHIFASEGIMRRAFTAPSSSTSRVVKEGEPPGPKRELLAANCPTLGCSVSAAPRKYHPAQSSASPGQDLLIHTPKGRPRHLERQARRVQEVIAPEQGQGKGKRQAQMRSQGPSREGHDGRRCMGCVDRSAATRVPPTAGRHHAR
jgi:hypothetical protein